MHELILPSVRGFGYIHTYVWIYENSVKELAL